MSTKATSNNNASSAEAHKAFSDHIAELRSRAFWVVVVFILASALAYSYREPLIDIVMSPLGSQQLVYLTPGGGFSFIFQVTMYAGAVVSAPLIVFHLYRFLRPALPARAQRNSSAMMLSSLLLMAGGVAFGYFVAIPSALAFLTTFAGDFVSPNLTAESYISFVMAYLVGLGVLFQLPLFLIIWNWISPIKPGGLLNSQRFVIGFSFIAAAIITPTPDIVNQSLVAGPIIGIYQLGVIAVFFMNRRALRKTLRQTQLAKPAVKSSAPVTAPQKPTPARVPVHSVATTSAPKAKPVMDIVAKSPMKKAPITHKPIATHHSVRQVTPQAIAKTAPHRSGVDGFIGGRPAGAHRIATPAVVPRRPVTPTRAERRPVQKRPSRSTMVNTLMSSPRSSVALDGFSIY